MYGNGTHVFPNCLLKREGVSTQPLGQPGSCAAQTQPSFSGLGSSPGPGLGDSQNPTERLSRAGTSPSTPPTTPHFRDHTGAVPGGGLGQRPFIRTTDWSWPPELICEQPKCFSTHHFRGWGPERTARILKAAGSNVQLPSHLQGSASGSGPDVSSFPPCLAQLLPSSGRYLPPHQPCPVVPASSPRRQPLGCSALQRTGALCPPLPPGEPQHLLGPPRDSVPARPPQAQRPLTPCISLPGREPSVGDTAGSDLLSKHTMDRGDFNCSSIWKLALGLLKSHHEVHWETGPVAPQELGRGEHRLSGTPRSESKSFLGKKRGQ